MDISHWEVSFTVMNYLTVIFYIESNRENFWWAFFHPIAHSLQYKYIETISFCKLRVSSPSHEQSVHNFVPNLNLNIIFHIV